MAILVGTATTYTGSPGVVGQRESLADVIYMISPDTTPFLSNIGRGTATAVYEEWQTQALAAPNTGNAQFQGDDISSFATASVGVRLGNRTQIFRKEIAVSNTLDAVSKAGRKTEMAWQYQIRSREIKIDIESILLMNQAKAVGAAATAPLLGSVLSFIKTNSNHVGTNPAGDGSNTRVDGTPRALTEAMMGSTLQSLWTNSGEEIDVLMVGGSNKRVVSGFSGGAQKQVDVMEKKTVQTVDVYVSDFFTFTILANRWMRPRDALFLNYNYWAMNWLRPLRKLDLATTGDAAKAALIGEGTLIAKNEAANAGIFDLTSP